MKRITEQPLNQAGVPVVETTIFAGWNPCEPVERDELITAINLLCGHLDVHIVRTNKTKHGTTEIALVDESL